MLIAGSICLTAAALAVVPVAVMRLTFAGPTAAGFAQAALVGTMIHLFVSAGAAAFLLLTKAPLAPAFTYWLMAFYWTTLAAVVAVMITQIRAAAAAAARHSAPPGAAAAALKH